MSSIRACVCVCCVLFSHAHFFKAFARVSAPFHSRHMAPAASVLAAALARGCPPPALEPASFALPAISNVTARPYFDGGGAVGSDGGTADASGSGEMDALALEFGLGPVAATLVAQVTAPVRWHDSLLYCVDRHSAPSDGGTNGDDTGAAEPPFFVELGPGTVLTALATRGVKKGCARAVDDPASLAAFLEDDVPRAILSSRGV